MSVPNFCPACGKPWEPDMMRNDTCRLCGKALIRAEPELTTRQRVLLVHERLFKILYEESMLDMTEFTKGGISACCVILACENPITGNTYTGDLAKILEASE